MGDIRSNRKNALVEIADKVGTFDNPPKPDLTKEKWSVHGNFFWRKVDGDATRHPEWVRAVREHKPNDDPYMRHIGFPVLPGFNLTATAIEGEVFNLPDLVWSVKSTPTSCPGGTKNICSLTNNLNDVSDVRIQGVKSFILSPPTFIFEPPVPQ